MLQSWFGHNVRDIILSAPRSAGSAVSVGEAAQPAWVCLSRHAGVSSVTAAVGGVVGLGGCGGSRSHGGLRITPAQGSAGAVRKTEHMQKAARVCPRGHQRDPGDGRAADASALPLLGTVP